MESHSFPYHHVIVVGTTGSGKSTLAEKLLQLHQVTGSISKFEIIDLDALYWLPNWEHLSDVEFRARVDEATRRPNWVMTGNYSVARDVSWPRAEAAIWLDYPLWTIFRRLWRRTWRRWWTRELLWGTNRERLWQQFKIWSPEGSLFRWLFATYWRRKREFPVYFAMPDYAHLKVIHLRTPQETDAWLQNLKSNSP